MTKEDIIAALNAIDCDVVTLSKTRVQVIDRQGQLPLATLHPDQLEDVLFIFSELRKMQTSRVALTA